jgi:uncharacterized protein (TIGR02266 family)
VSEHDSSQLQAASIRARLKYASIEQFIEGFGQNLSRGGVFVKTSSPRTVGTKVRFCFQMADGTVAVDGVGVVEWIRQTVTAEGPAGMGIRFQKVTPATTKLVEQIEEIRRNKALADHSRFSLLRGGASREKSTGAKTDKHKAEPGTASPSIPQTPQRASESQGDMRPRSATLARSARSTKGKAFDMDNVDDLLAKLSGKPSTPSNLGQRHIQGATATAPRPAPISAVPAVVMPAPEPLFKKSTFPPEPSTVRVSAQAGLNYSETVSEEDEHAPEFFETPQSPKRRAAPPLEGPRDDVQESLAAKMSVPTDALPEDGLPADKYETLSFLPQEEAPSPYVEPPLFEDEGDDAATMSVQNGKPWMRLEPGDPGVEVLEVLEELEELQELQEAEELEELDGPDESSDVINDVTRPEDLGHMAAASAFAASEDSEITERFKGAEALQAMYRLSSDEAVPTGRFEEDVQHDAETAVVFTYPEATGEQSIPELPMDELMEEPPTQKRGAFEVPDGLEFREQGMRTGMGLYDSIIPPPENASVPVPEAPVSEETPKKGFFKKLFGGS